MKNIILTLLLALFSTVSFGQSASFETDADNFRYTTGFDIVENANFTLSATGTYADLSEGDYFGIGLAGSLDFTSPWINIPLRAAIEATPIIGTRKATTPLPLSRPDRDLQGGGIGNVFLGVHYKGVSLGSSLSGIATKGTSYIFNPISVRISL